MEPLEFGDLPEEALLLVDSPPVIYILEDHSKFGPRFAPLFAAHAAGRLPRGYGPRSVSGWRTPCRPRAHWRSTLPRS
jgi:hypothetical protein